jgi:uncharacterized protein (DUF1810 family)
MTSEHSLQRFLDAQEEAYPQALAEIKQGQKRSHWMWYIFPQIQGLGFSSTSKYYALQDAREAEAYLQHPLLGSRLIQLCEELLRLPENNANRIFGSPDDLKLKSCLTLFSSVPQSRPIFQAVLDKFFKGQPDTQTLRILNS